MALHEASDRSKPTPHLEPGGSMSLRVPGLRAELLVPWPEDHAGKEAAA